MSKEFRTLNANEIEVRNNGVYSNSQSTYGNFLIYKNARVDISILNETYGRKWRRYHRVEGEYFICGVSVYNDDLKEWVSYEDTGEPSYSHSNKGLFSDSFKRACVNLGIGIELYTAPDIRIELNNGEYTKKGDNYKLWVSFFVSEIAYDDKRNITKLVIKDNNYKERFRFEIPDYSIVNYGKNKGKEWVSLPIIEIVKGLNHYVCSKEYDFVNGILDSIKSVYIDADTNLCAGDTIIFNKNNRYYSSYIEDELYTQDTKKHYFVINNKHIEATDIYSLGTVLVLNTEDRLDRLKKKYSKKLILQNKVV